jgi:hypothetical protein
MTDASKMNENIIQEILHELFSSMEALDTQSTALLEFVKEKGIVSEEELQRHLEQAGNASSVRWRAVRVRIDYLLSSAMKAAEQEAQKTPPKTQEKSAEPPQNKSAEASQTSEQSNEPEKEEKKDAQDNPRPASDGQTEIEESGARVDKDRDEPEKNKGKENQEDIDKNAREQTAKKDREKAA